MSKETIVVWFSCGAASAVAASGNPPARVGAVAIIVGGNR